MQEVFDLYVINIISLVFSASQGRLAWKFQIQRHECNFAPRSCAPAISARACLDQDGLLGEQNRACVYIRAVEPLPSQHKLPNAHMRAKSEFQRRSRLCWSQNTKASGLSTGVPHHVAESPLPLNHCPFGQHNGHRSRLPLRLGESESCYLVFITPRLHRSVCPIRRDHAHVSLQHSGRSSKQRHHRTKGSGCSFPAAGK